jgi:hypothetical protein
MVEVLVFEISTASLPSQSSTLPALLIFEDGGSMLPSTSTFTHQPAWPSIPQYFNVNYYSYFGSCNTKRKVTKYTL